MPSLSYSIDLTASPLELAAQALTVVRVREFAKGGGLTIQESEGTFSRDFSLRIPADRMNAVLWELDLRGLLQPNQVLSGPADLYASLEERFACLEWVDALD